MGLTIIFSFFLQYQLLRLSTLKPYGDSSTNPENTNRLSMMVICTTLRVELTDQVLPAWSPLLRHRPPVGADEMGTVTDEVGKESGVGIVGSLRMFFLIQKWRINSRRSPGRVIITVNANDSKLFIEPHRSISISLYVSDGARTDNKKSILKHKR